MKAVVQRVASASVEVDGRIVSAIGPGLLVLVGLHDSDTDSDADYICRKVLNMRLFPNQITGKTWDLSVIQKNYEVLLVSQFTLYGILKGNKPDFHVAMSPDRAKPFYASVVEKFQKAYKSDAVKDGIFGAMMKVNLVNDGPITMQLDSQSSKVLGKLCLENIVWTKNCRGPVTWKTTNQLFVQQVHYNSLSKLHCAGPLAANIGMESCAER